MDITQKISLYDILAMIVPGLLLMFLYCAFTIGMQATLLLLHKGGIIEITFTIAASYIIGIIWNSTMECIFHRLRNNRDMIALSRKYKLRKCSIGILKSGIICLLKGNIWRKNKSNFVTHEYYRRYYFVMKNRYCDNISILEGHVAFLRNMLFVIFLYGIAFVRNNQEYIDCCVSTCYCVLHLLNIIPCKLHCIGWFFFILAFLMFVVMIFKQQKIYKLVFEDYEYLSKLK